jgi:hypothetical protein
VDVWAGFGRFEFSCVGDQFLALSLLEGHIRWLR